MIKSMNTKMRFQRNINLFRIIFNAVFVVVLMNSCRSVRPTVVSSDRMDYGQVVAESWKRETLLNVVRLRYADAPVFLEVSSIINSRSVEGSVAAAAGFPGASPSGVMFDFGGSQRWSNTPTVSYQPVMGEGFTRSLLRPIQPASVFQLIQGGWNAELVLRTIVSSINGLHNSSAGVAADSSFLELIKTISNIQQSGGLGVRVESVDNINVPFIVIPNKEEGFPSGIERNRIRELLQLNKTDEEFMVEYGLLPHESNEIHMISRSMLDLMLQLGFGIDIPPEHLAEGRVLPAAWKSGDRHAKVLTHIHSGIKEPTDACVSVQYKNYWYWIEDTDLTSKQHFTFLMILFSLAETGQTISGPVVTVPSR